MAAFERVLEGIKQILFVAEDIKRLSESVKSLGGEVRDIDRRVARLEGAMAAQAHGLGAPRRRIAKSDE